MSVYVTNTGFVKKTLQQIRTEQEEKFKEVFGNNIDLDPDGPFGLIIGIMSKDLADMWDAAEEIYTSRDPNQATGSSLGFISAENGLIRFDATQTTAENVFLYGTEGTIVPADRQARQDSAQEDRYSLASSVTITEAAAREVLFSVDTPSSAGQTYTVGIDSVDYTYVTVGGETKGDIIDELVSSITSGSWVGLATNDGDEFLKLQDVDTNFAITTKTKIAVDTLASGGTFVCDTAGARALPANTLTVIVTPVSGWDSVNNPSSGTIGRNEETDAELRIRRASVFTATGNATDLAIRSKLLQNVPNITAVNVISNREFVTDSDGRPPKSFEAIVAGGGNQDIGDEIWRTQPAGVTSYGNQTVTVYDSNSQPQLVYFSRSTTKYIWVKVKRDLYDEEIYPTDGDDLIKSNIVLWSQSTQNIDVGKDVIRQRLSIPIYEVPGIDNIEITLGVTTNPGDPEPTYSASNIAISIREIADFAASRITVEDLTP